LKDINYKLAIRPAFLFLLYLSGIVIPGCGLHGQTAQVKDSLKQKLENASPDPDRIKILNALAYEYYDFDDSIGFSYARKALALATRLNDSEGLKESYTMMGIGHFSFGEYDEALNYFRLSDVIKYTQKTADNHLYNLMLTGNVLTDLGRFDTAVLVYNKGIALANQLNNLSRLSNLYKSYARLKAQLWQNDEALAFIKKSESLSNTKNPYSLIDLYYVYARVYMNLNDYKKSEEYIDKLCNAVDTLDDNFHKSICDLLWAELYFTRGNYSQALTRSFNALEITKVYAYHLLRAQIYLKTGEIYTELSEYDLAMSFYLRALAITEKSGMNPLTAQIFAEIAWIYKDQKNYVLALEYLHKSQIIRQRIGDKKGVANCHNIRGLVFLLQEKYTESIQEHEKALEIRESIMHKEGVAASLYNTSLAHKEMGNLNKALELQYKALEIDEVIGNAQSLAISYNGLAELLMRMNRLPEARGYVNKSFALAKKTKSKLLMRSCYATFTSFYKVSGNYRKALEYAEKYKQLNDSIFSEGNSMKLAEMQALYQVERKEAEIELLNTEKELNANKLTFQQAKIRNQVYIIIIGSVLLLIVIVFSVFTYLFNRRLVEAKGELADVNEELITQSEELREANQGLIKLNDQLIEKQEEIQAQSEELTESNDTLLQLNEALQEKTEEIEAQSEELREANETILTNNKTLEQKVDERTQQLRQAYTELDTFFYRSSHDFRRPITTFMGLAEVAKITVKDENAIDLFEKVSETAHNLDKMLRKLQSISDVGAQDLVYKEVLLRELIENTLVDFQSDLSTKDFKVIEDIKLSKPFYSYAALIKVIIENLLENAIQFSTIENPFIKISAQQTDDLMTILVEDNGQGIAEEYHDRIFDMYFRANLGSKGNGLGLYVVKKAVEKLAGTIRFESKHYRGSLFVVELPNLQPKQM